MSSHALGHSDSPAGSHRGAEPVAAVSIRDARRTDGDAVAGIYNEAIRSGRITMDAEPVDADYFAGPLCQSSRESLLVGCFDGQVVAWGIVKQYSARAGYRFTCETSVYVTEAHQQRGFGGVLQKAVMGRARALGYRHLVAKILAVNAASIRFHERFGYEVVGRQRAVGYLNGTWHDVVIMQCVLNEIEQLTSEEES